MTDRRHSAEDVDRAVAALSGDTDRFAHAQEIVTHAAPTLHRILGEAMSAGGWHQASAEQAARIAAIEDPERRTAELQTLAAEEARLGMLVGVAVGIELSRELENPTEAPQ